MDAIDNRVTSSSSVEAANEGDLTRASAAAKEDSDSQIAKKEIQELQQEQLQEQVYDAHPPISATDPTTEWDPWRITALRHQ